MTLFLKKRIKELAKIERLTIPSDYKQILYKYLNIGNIMNVRITFLWSYDMGTHFLGANAAIPKLIIFNREWAANIVLHDSPETLNAYKITLGHELTHQDKEFSPLKCAKSDKQFIHWVNEVHADFGGSQKMCNSSRNALVQACEYKYNYKIKQHYTDRDTKTHPSWSRRIEYAKHYNFDNKLFHQIAKDVNCNNHDLINTVIVYYAPIILQ